MKTYLAPTRFAELAVWESDGIGPAVLLLHGNSSCKEVFRRQFESPLGTEYRLIAIDLPGHGASSDAHDPASGYILSGYAHAAVELLRQLGVARAAVYGWSLGGHIAMDMMSRYPGLAGVMTSGAPPVPPGAEGVALGLRQTPTAALAGARDWSAADTEAFARAAAGSEACFEPFMLDAARRAHGISREVFFADVFAKGPDDQRRIAETSKIPLAIVNGAEDPFVVHGYFDTVQYANLWDGEVRKLAGVGHAPFWEAPDQFNPLIERFVTETAGAAQ